MEKYSGKLVHIKWLKEFEISSIYREKYLEKL